MNNVQGHKLSTSKVSTVQFDNSVPWYVSEVQSSRVDLVEIRMSVLKDIPDICKGKYLDAVPHLCRFKNELLVSWNFSVIRYSRLDISEIGSVSVLR
jgi:GTP cyclohydrolase III